MQTQTVKLSTLKFTSLATTNIAHTSGKVSFINVSIPNQENEPATIVEVALLHTLEGGIVQLKNIEVLSRLESGDAITVISDGSVEKVNKDSVIYKGWCETPEGKAYGQLISAMIAVQAARDAEVLREQYKRRSEQ